MPRQNALDQASQKMDMSSIAALSFLVWDILITLDQEVVAIWSRTNTSYSKWLFFFVRYFTVAMQISLLFVGTEFSIGFHYTESDCVKWYIFQEVGTQLLIATVESILIVRVHALYERNRKVTGPLVVLFLLENIAMMITLIFVVPGVQFDATCTVVGSPPSLVIFAAAFILFESVLFILTLAKFLVALRSGWGRTPVVFLLVRDGTWAFILIFVTLCINAGFYLGEGNTAIAAIAYPWLLSVESFAGARIVLNLHTISSDLSTNAYDTNVDGALSSHIVFTTHSTEEGNRPYTPSVRWDWGGIQRYPHGEHSGHATTSPGGTSTTSESYEMTSTAGSSSLGNRKHKAKASTSVAQRTDLSTCSDVFVMDSHLGVRWPLRICAFPNYHFASVARFIAGQGGWPVFTYVCQSPRFLVVEVDEEIRILGVRRLSPLLYSANCRYTGDMAPTSRRGTATPVVFWVLKWNPSQSLTAVLYTCTACCQNGL